MSTFHNRSPNYRTLGGRRPIRSEDMAVEDLAVLVDWKRKDSIRQQIMVVARGIVMEWYMTKRSYERDMREMGRPSLKNGNEAGVEVHRKRGGTTIRGMIEGTEEETEAVIEAEVAIEMMIEIEIGEGVETETTSTGREGDDELLQVDLMQFYIHVKVSASRNRLHNVSEWLELSYLLGSRNTTLSIHIYLSHYESNIDMLNEDASGIVF